MRRNRGLRHDLADVDSWARIFVNRNLRLKSIKAIGFDMDHTLAVYKQLPLEKLAFEKTQKKMVELGYPAAVKRLKYQPQFVTRGLLVDTRRGNILKMDRHRYVVTACHGTRKLPSAKRRGIYANSRIRLGAVNYVPVDTLFSLPEISLYAQIVDLYDAEPQLFGKRLNYRQMYLDTRKMMDTAHADGSIKRVMARNPMRFLEIDPDLPETLFRMRSQGIKLFLLTNSEASFTSLIMNLLLSDKRDNPSHWSDYFDLILVRAEKPAFFSEHGELEPLAPRALKAHSRKGKSFTFTGGSVRGLEQVLGIKGDDILYFGDHTYGDILKSKRNSGWRTAMIIKSLERELLCREAVREQREGLAIIERRIDQLASWRDYLRRAIEGQVTPREIRRFLRERRFSGGIRDLPKHLEYYQSQIHALGVELEQLEQEIDQGFNSHWGSIFRAGRETSYFAKQVEDFACIYTSRVSNFLNYPLEKYFVTTHVFMPHEFYTDR